MRAGLPDGCGSSCDRGLALVGVGLQVCSVHRQGQGTAGLWGVRGAGIWWPALPASGHRHSCGTTLQAPVTATATPATSSAVPHRCPVSEDPRHSVK